jgi:Excalibur calcium-binding domain
VQKRMLTLAVFTSLVLAAGGASAGGPPQARAADRDCSDFPNQAAAQSYFISRGGPGSDPDRLDADHDGVACESLPCPCSNGNGGGGTKTPSTAPTCGKERWAVKTLSDPDARKVDFHPRPTTVDKLRALRKPGDLGTRRLAREKRTYKLKARLIEAKQEDDRDIHLVIADLKHASHTMIVEFPDTTCPGARSSFKKSVMARARAAFVKRFGKPSTSHFEALSGTATLNGVLFFDFIHGQRGVAPRGVELHPVLSFR